MPLKAVLDFYKGVKNLGITTWLDGGQGVDALLGKQTREHGDLDIAVQTKDLAKLRTLLEEKGFKNVPRDNTQAWNFVLGNNEGHEIDFHVITLDQNGDGIYGPPDNNEKYPASALTGKGQLMGIPVRCIFAEDAVKFHTGYEHDENDYHDVKSLCVKFNISLPGEYKKFEGQF